VDGVVGKQGGQSSFAEIVRRMAGVLETNHLEALGEVEREAEHLEETVRNASRCSHRHRVDVESDHRRDFYVLETVIS
jgi:hypothetical protein